MTIVEPIMEFLLARIAEDEALAQEAIKESVYRKETWDRELPIIQHITCHNPNHLLAECAAKRAFIRDAQPVRTACPSDDWFGGAQRIYNDGLRIMATVYSRHPDFDPAWRV